MDANENDPQVSNYSTIIVDLDPDDELGHLLDQDQDKKIPTPKARKGIFADLLPSKPPFVCPVCNREAESRYKLRRHYRNHQERKHACSFCDQKFLYLKDKRIHERIHTGERPFVCHVCEKAFVQKCTLANHLITHNKAKKEEVCDLCGKAYYYKKSLAQHKKEKHSEIQKPYKCVSCGKRFTGRSGYCMHLRKCHKDENVLHSCTDCGRGYQRLDILEKHKRRCSGRIFQCGVCDKTLSTEESLSKHMFTVHDISYSECIQVHVDGNLDKQNSGLHPTIETEILYEAYHPSNPGEIHQLIVSQPGLQLGQAS